MSASEPELKLLLDRWLDCSLPEAEFTHRAHLAVCTYIAWHNTLPDTYAAMKNGLVRFNEAKGVPNSDTRGYHETLTRFWCALLFFSIHNRGFESCAEAANSMLNQYGTMSRAEREYYSFDVLKSTDARRNWIPPELPGRVPLHAFAGFVNEASVK